MNDFNFRIVNISDGNQIIDRTHGTSCEELTPVQMVEHVELEARLYHMDRIERDAKRMAQEKRKFIGNSLYKIACMVGII